MKTLSLSRRDFLVASAAALFLPRLANGATALPGDSIYQLHASLVDQDGRAFELASLRGTPLLFSMFYTSCDMVCPMIFETVQTTLRALPAAERPSVRVLMVSYDPARDSVDVLKKTAAARGCDEHWTLARADETTVRKIAAAFGFQYRRLASGEFNHSTLIELVDRDGRVVARTGKLGTVDPQLVKATRQVLSRPA
jgi:protein SCO1